MMVLKLAVVTGQVLATPVTSAGVCKKFEGLVRLPSSFVQTYNAHLQVPPRGKIRTAEEDARDHEGWDLEVQGYSNGKCDCDFGPRDYEHYYEAGASDYVRTCKPAKRRGAK